MPALQTLSKAIRKPFYSDGCSHLAGAIARNGLIDHEVRIFAGRGSTETKGQQLYSVSTFHRARRYLTRLKGFRSET